MEQRGLHGPDTGTRLVLHLHRSNQDPQVSVMVWLPRSLGSERAPVGPPVGTGELGLGVNWTPAGATAAAALRRWAEPGGEASACCAGFGFTSKTLRGLTVGNYTPKKNEHSLPQNPPTLTITVLSSV